MIAPAYGIALWLLLTVGSLAAVAFILRLVVRAVRGLERRSMLAEEVLLLSARVDQQARELAEVKAKLRQLTDRATRD